LLWWLLTWPSAHSGSSQKAQNRAPISESTDVSKREDQRISLPWGERYREARSRGITNRLLRGPRSLLWPAVTSGNSLLASKHWNRADFGNLVVRCSTAAVSAPSAAKSTAWNPVPRVDVGMYISLNMRNGLCIKRTACVFTVGRPMMMENGRKSQPEFMSVLFSLLPEEFLFNTKTIPKKGNKKYKVHRKIVPKIKHSTRTQKDIGSAAFLTIFE